MAEAIGRPPILALTATASPPVRREIVTPARACGDPYIAVRGFDRPNIRLEVAKLPPRARQARGLRRAGGRRAEAGDRLRRHAQARRAAGRDARRGRGRRRRPTTAGWRPSCAARRRSASWRDDIEVIVATTAFGMGIDKPNVRWVLHYEVADSVDSYWQEVGRAGRDGEPATGLLLYRPEDLGLRRFFAGSGQVDHDELELVGLALTAHGGPTDPAELRDEINMSESKLTTAVSRLEEAGAVEVTAAGEIALTDGPIAEPAVDRAAAGAGRPRVLRPFAHRDDARASPSSARAAGAPSSCPTSASRGPDPCGNCDMCEAGLGESGATEEPYAIGGRVRHRRMGRRDGPALRARRGGRPVRRGRLQDPRSRGRPRARTARRALKPDRSSTGLDRAWMNRDPGWASSDSWLLIPGPAGGRQGDASDPATPNASARRAGSWPSSTSTATVPRGTRSSSGSFPSPAPSPRATRAAASPWRISSRSPRWAWSRPSIASTCPGSSPSPPSPSRRSSASCAATSATRAGTCTSRAGCRSARSRSTRSARSSPSASTARRRPTRSPRRRASRSRT